MNSATRLIAEQPASADDDHVIGGEGHLAHEVRGQEDGPALIREAAQQVADPADAVGVQPVDRFVEDQRLRVRQQRGCDPQGALAHPQRERARPVAGLDRWPAPPARSLRRPAAGPSRWWRP